MFGWIVLISLFIDFITIYLYLVNMVSQLQCNCILTVDRSKKIKHIRKIYTYMKLICVKHYTIIKIVNCIHGIMNRL